MMNFINVCNFLFYSFVAVYFHNVNVVKSQGKQEEEEKRMSRKRKRRS